MIHRLASAILLPLILLPLPGLAEQRALLVGVGQYETPGIDLPGIDLDIERMRETLTRLGFEDRQIRTLADGDATSANVIAGFEGWLKQGVQPNDRVVFYYSGHGSNVPDLDGDEDDKVDEVLVTHDMRRARVKGRATLTGVVTDDKLATLIAALPSKHIWIIIDACHSGTMTRSFSMRNRSLGSEPVYVKSFTYTGMPEGGHSALARDFERSPAASNFVALSAAGDGEKAIGTSVGGVFTIGLTETIKRMATEGKGITVNELRDQTTEYIRNKVDKDQVHHPQITGNAELASAALKLVSPSATGGPNRRKLLELVAAHPNRLEITASNARYAVDEPVKLMLKLPVRGYLNLVSVDAQDTATVLFPNRYQQDNTVSAGPLAMPTPQMAFELLAAEPLGETLLVAFVSSDPINFYQQSIDNRDENGNIKVDFSTLSPTATRAIRVAPRSSETYAAELEVQIVAPR
jgi:hypothetical protein